MARYHKGAKLDWLKRCLFESYAAWSEKMYTRGLVISSNEVRFNDVIEFLIQEGFLSGRKWLDYIDEIPEDPRRYSYWRSAMVEGYIPGDTVIGRREGEKNDVQQEAKTD